MENVSEAMISGGKRFLVVFWAWIEEKWNVVYKEVKGKLKMSQKPWYKAGKEFYIFRLEIEDTWWSVLKEEEGK